MKTAFKALLAAAALASVLTTTASAGLIFDRGLPTANLNNISGANRSNVAWADTAPTLSMGDNFTLSSADVINGVRVWVVTRSTLTTPNAFTLWLGSDTGIPATTNVAAVATSTSVTLANYADASTYQASGGDMINIYQVDFFGLSLAYGPGTYAFGVSGTPGRDDVATPFLHSSNGPLSGSTQMGSDGFIYGFDSLGLMVTGYPWNSNGAGWDKSSDVNVQVFVPEPSNVALLAIALMSLLGFGMMRRQSEA